MKGNTEPVTHKRLCIFGPKGAIQICYYYYYYYYYYLKTQTHLSQPMTENYAKHANTEYKKHC